MAYRSPSPGTFLAAAKSQFVVVGGYADTRVLVTGAGGFIGSLLCRRLLQEGAEVTALVRPGRAYPRLEGLDGLSTLCTDLAQGRSVEEGLEAVRPRLVFHLAASVDRSRNPGGIPVLLRDNVAGTLHLLRAAAEAGVRRLIHTGSAEEYGRGPVPFAEDQAACPTTPYGASKATATLWCQAAHAAFGLETVTARLFMVYGPHQPPDFFLPQLLEAARRRRALEMTAGEQRRDFTWVEDVVEALLRLGTAPGLGGRIFNVCTGKGTSLREVVRVLEEVLGREVPVSLGALPYREGEVFESWGSPQALEKAVGYRPPTSLREGLGRLVADLR